jgi:hypothetical protein
MTTINNLKTDTRPGELFQCTAVVHDIINCCNKVARNILFKIQRREKLSIV